MIASNGPSGGAQHHPECGPGYPQPGCHPQCPIVQRGNEVVRVAAAKREGIIELLRNGGTVAEVAERMDCSDRYVFRVQRDHRSLISPEA